MAKNKLGGMKSRQIVGDTLTYIFLITMSIVWLLPFFWLVMQSFRDGKGQFISTFLPTAYTLNNYKALLTEFDVMNFPKMFMNTFMIACCSCVISTFFVLSVSYCTSRLKWPMRKPYMNMAMILNLFPGFMTMVAVYFILKALGMTEGRGHAGLVRRSLGVQAGLCMDARLPSEPLLLLRAARLCGVGSSLSPSVRPSPARASGIQQTRKCH